MEKGIDDAVRFSISAAFREPIDPSVTMDDYFGQMNRLTDRQLDGYILQDAKKFAKMYVICEDAKCAADTVRALRKQTKKETE